jgi:hypothetical protein
MLPGPGRRTVLGPLGRGRSHTSPSKVLLRQTYGYFSGSALLTPPVVLSALTSPGPGK